MEKSTSSLAKIADWARSEPVMTALTPLDKRILESRHGISVVESLEKFYSLFESPDHIFTSDIVINDTGTLDLDHSLTTYSPPDVQQIEYTGSPYRHEMNEWVTSDWLSWDDIEETTLNQSDVVDTIVNSAGDAEVVAFIVVDGLSFSDWHANGHAATPVYVDCPTITHCGYPNAIQGGPIGDSVANRLYDYGIENRYAFTYWEKEQNELTERLHSSFSANDVVGDIQDFSDVISFLKHEEWYSDRTYLQITLTGPERVAHKHKEDPNIQAEVEAIYEKISNLHSLLKQKVSSHKIFATADHGMLWRMDVGDEFKLADGDWDHYERRCIENPDTTEVATDQGQVESWDGDNYLRLYYPYLFSGLSSNEPGTHGGFSFQESIVPLIELSQN